MSINGNFLGIAKRIKGTEKEVRRLGTLEQPPNYAERRNYLINSNIDVAQRAPALSIAVVSGQFAVDRWMHIRDGTAGTVAMGQQGFTVGTNLGGSEGVYYLRLNQTVSGTGQTYKGIQQRIEDVQQLAGQTVAGAFWARSVLATTISARIDQNFGTGGSAAALGTSTATFALPANAWTYCTYNYAIPSCAGKIIGPNSYTVLILFDISANGPAVNALDFDQITLQPGLIASPYPFLKKSFADELIACQRYYQKSFPYNVAPAQNVGSNVGTYGDTVKIAGISGNTLGMQPFPVVMRISPAITFYNPGAANAFVRNLNATTDSTATSSNGYTSERGLGVSCTGLAAWTVGQALGVHWSADAEL